MSVVKSVGEAASANSGQLGWKETGWVESLRVAVPGHLFSYFLLCVFSQILDF